MIVRKAILSTSPHAIIWVTKIQRFGFVWEKKKKSIKPLFSTFLVVATHFRPNVVWTDLINDSFRALSKPVKKRIWVVDAVRPRRRGGGAIGNSLWEGFLHRILSRGDRSLDLVDAETRSIAVLPFLFLYNRKNE